MTLSLKGSLLFSKWLFFKTFLFETEIRERQKEVKDSETVLAFINSFAVSSLNGWKQTISFPAIRLVKKGTAKSLASYIYLFFSLRLTFRFFLSFFLSFFLFDLPWLPTKLDAFLTAPATDSQPLGKASVMLISFRRHVWWASQRFDEKSRLLTKRKATIKFPLYQRL